MEKDTKELIMVSREEALLLEYNKNVEQMEEKQNGIADMLSYDKDYGFTNSSYSEKLLYNQNMANEFEAYMEDLNVLGPRYFDSKAILTMFKTAYEVEGINEDLDTFSKDTKIDNGVFSHKVVKYLKDMFYVGKENDFEIDINNTEQLESILYTSKTILDEDLRLASLQIQNTEKVQMPRKARKQRIAELTKEKEELKELINLVKEAEATLERIKKHYNNTKEFYQKRMDDKINRLKMMIMPIDNTLLDFRDNYASFIKEILVRIRRIENISEALDNLYNEERIKLENENIVRRILSQENN